MGNQWTKVSNKTCADFYVLTFNDQDLIPYSIVRIPADETVKVKSAAGKAMKVGICYHVDAPNVVTCPYRGDIDLWRVQNNRQMNIVFIGDKRGAGLDKTHKDITYMDVKTYRFDTIDSRAIKLTTPSIVQWERDHQNNPVYK